MAISVFDLFKIGIGPSSSHTVGPMRAAEQFASELKETHKLHKTDRIKAEMFGSLGATGKGHGTPKAVILGLEGDQPATVDIETIDERIERITSCKKIACMNEKVLDFDPETDLLLIPEKQLLYHPNGMCFTAFDTSGTILLEKTYYSIGGGFVIDERHAAQDFVFDEKYDIPYPFNTANELMALCRKHSLSIAELMWQNERAFHSDEEITAGLLQIWNVMQKSVQRGIAQQEGVLPGGLNVKRRAPAMYRKLMSETKLLQSDPLKALEWVSMYAIAVNEENASGGRIVTAPTNGAAGIIPAVLHYYLQFSSSADKDGIVSFLLTACAIGMLYKKNASISGAEMGCQGEVGVACSMAAAALAHVLGGTTEQVENAAEIAMEHNLGLTCDPVAGLVQIPCIERNAQASVAAINAAKLALNGNGSHIVSLDTVIKTMKQTGKDMMEKYKETSTGGLAVHVIEC